MILTYVFGRIKGNDIVLMLPRKRVRIKVLDDLCDADYSGLDFDSSGNIIMAN